MYKYGLLYGNDATMLRRAMVHCGKALTLNKWDISGQLNLMCVIALISSVALEEQEGNGDDNKKLCQIRKHYEDMNTISINPSLPSNITEEDAIKLVNLCFSENNVSSPMYSSVYKIFFICH